MGKWMGTEIIIRKKQETDLKDSIKIIIKMGKESSSFRMETSTMEISKIISCTEKESIIGKSRPWNLADFKDNFIKELFQEKEYFTFLMEIFIKASFKKENFMGKEHFINKMPSLRVGNGVKEILFQNEKKPIKKQILLFLFHNNYYFFLPNFWKIF